MKGEMELHVCDGCNLGIETIQLTITTPDSLRELPTDWSWLVQYFGGGKRFWKFCEDCTRGLRK